MYSCVCATHTSMHHYKDTSPIESSGEADCAHENNLVLLQPVSLPYARLKFGQTGATCKWILVICGAVSHTANAATLLEKN